MKNENTLQCVYFENGINCESDNVAKEDLQSYFKDSFKYHTGNFPSSQYIETYLFHFPVIFQRGNLIHHWECS